MALAEICKIADAPYMRMTKNLSADLENDLKKYSSNFENAYQLSAPPFQNVSKLSL